MLHLPTETGAVTLNFSRDLGLIGFVDHHYYLNVITMVAPLVVNCWTFTYDLLIFRGPKRMSWVNKHFIKNIAL